MASQVLDILTVAARLATHNGVVCPEELVDNILVTSYPKTPRGKGALNEYFRMVQKDHPNLPIWAETARVWFAKTGRKPLVTPPPTTQTATAPQAQAPQPAQGVLLSDGGMNLNGRNYSSRQLKFFGDVLHEYLRLRKAAQ